jgi:hypothetical protein
MMLAAFSAAAIGQNQLVGSDPCGCLDKSATRVMGKPRATSTSCAYLYPYNLHLTPGSRSSVPLQVRDEAGNAVPGRLTFSNYDTSLISIAADGYVTAKRLESTTEIGTWVTGLLDGAELANTSIVRVLSTDYHLAFTETAAASTICYFPPSVQGENISTLISQYQIPQILESAYAAQQHIMGLQPFGGCKQIFEVDFGETEEQRVCGISGNPIRIGWNIKGNQWQNCLLVPFLPPRSPQWGVIFHELGHNFTWPSYTFAVGLGMGLADYSEGIATAIGLATSLEILRNPTQYHPSSETEASIEWVLVRDTTGYSGDLQNWLNGGAPFSAYNANIVDGIWLRYQRERPSDFVHRFFLPLQQQYESSISRLFPTIDNLGNDGRHTFYAALVSAAAGRDLSSTFTATYHFPIVQSLFGDLYQVFSGIIGIASSVEQSTDFMPTELHLEQNYPNPFNPSTTIRYELPSSGRVTLKILDLLGRQVKTLVDELQTAGTHSATFDAANIASGVYFYRLQLKGDVQTRKLIVLK